MPRPVNPFRPGGIAAPGMFAGRLEELLILQTALQQTAHENPQHFLVRGERGIGKSSLLYYLEALAKGEIPADPDDRVRLLVVSLAVDKHATFFDIVRRVGQELEKALAPLQRAREALKDAWHFFKRIEAFGVKYADAPPPAAAQDEALHAIVSVASAALDRLKPEIQGILILIDECDKAPASADLGLFSKLLTERLTRAKCNRVLLGLAGLPGLVEKLKKSHESAPRIFNIMSLAPLTVPERLEVLRLGLARAKDVNGRETTISPEAEQWIATLSEGYPHFIQQFAYAAFAADSDGHISIDDVLEGAMDENGAFRQLGLKYFEELYFEQIGAEEYRAVLRAMAETFDGWVSKEALRAKTGLKTSTLNNAIAALKKRNIILPKPGQAGVYRLPTKSFAVWIRGFTQTRGRPAGTSAPSV